tara:strand:- start:244 stop:351 length:108 start_codon:yes stop_codon:yes gene_type:complete
MQVNLVIKNCAMATPDGLMEKEEGAAKDEKIKCAE